MINNCDGNSLFNARFHICLPITLSAYCSCDEANLLWSTNTSCNFFSAWYFPSSNSSKKVSPSTSIPTELQKNEGIFLDYTRFFHPFYPFCWNRRLSLFSVQNLSLVCWTGWLSPSSCWNCSDRSHSKGWRSCCPCLRIRFPSPRSCCSNYWQSSCSPSNNCWELWCLISCIKDGRWDLIGLFWFIVWVMKMALLFFTFSFFFIFFSGYKNNLILLLLIATWRRRNSQ